MNILAVNETVVAEAAVLLVLVMDAWCNTSGSSCILLAVTVAVLY
jgi:hypothetical protein